MSAYPYPVLATKTDDILGVTFFTPEIINNTLYIKNAGTDNGYINDLISKGKAKYLLYVENSSAMFSRKYEFSDESITIPFDPHHFPIGKYSAELLLVAAAEINNFSSETFHDDYDGLSFSLSPASIIANFGYFAFDIRKSFSDFGEKESIFKWHPQDDPDLRGSFRLTTYEGHIVIIYHKDDRIDIIQHLQDRNKYLLITGYIIPALTWAIENLAKKYDEYNNDQWAITIINAMLKTGIIDDPSKEEVVNAVERENSVFIASSIMKQPLIGLSKGV